MEVLTVELASGSVGGTRTKVGKDQGASHHLHDAKDSHCVIVIAKCFGAGWIPTLSYFWLI